MRLSILIAFPLQLTDAITRVYKRCAIRYSNPIPTFNDLREELANWRDAEKMQRTIDEAHLAAIKLRSWTEGGIYAKLFYQPTTMRLDSDWLFFNVEGLSSDPRLATAMSMLIATAMSARATGKTGRPSITVLDECWFLLDSPALAPEVVQLYRTARKRNSSVWGISQTVEDFVGTESQPRVCQVLGIEYLSAGEPSQLLRRHRSSLILTGRAVDAVEGK